MYRILIVDNSRIFRQGLRFLLESRPNFEIVGDVDDQTALAVAIESTPSIIVMSLWLPRCEDGLAILTQFCESLPETRVIALTAANDEPHLVYRAVQAGAAGYVPKDTGDVAEVETAIWTVVKGQPYLSPDALNSLLESIKSGHGPQVTAGQTAAAELSPRELMILDQVAAGLTNRQIAAQMTITESTVRSHMHNILDKLKVTNRVQAAAFVLRSRSAAGRSSTNGNSHGSTFHPGSGRAAAGR